MTTVDDIFKEFDVDGNGKLDRGEFEKVMARLGMPAEETAMLFEQADADTDGAVDRSEFLSYLTTNTSRRVAFVFHTLGMYSLNAVGQGKKMPMEGGWHCSQVGIQTGSDTMLMCHSMGLYKVDMNTGASTHLSAAGEGWMSAKALLRCKKDPDHVLCLHTLGMYRIKIEDGSYETIAGDSWAQAREIVYDPVTDCAFVFHMSGLYKVDPKDGSYENVSGGFLGGGGWNEAHGAVYHPDGVVVFHAHGTYRVSLKDGSYEKFGGTWFSAQTAVRSGPDTALVLTGIGTYEVDLRTCESKKLPAGDNWMAVQCATQFGDDGMVAIHVEPRQN